MRVIDFMPRRGRRPAAPDADRRGRCAAASRCGWSFRCVRTTGRSGRGSSRRRTASSPPPGRTRSGSARRCRCEVEDGTVSAEFVVGRGRPRAAHAHLASLLRGGAAGRGRRLGAGPHGGVVAGVERALPLRGRVSRRGADLADRAQGDDLGDDRRGDRGADDLAAGGHRRRAQLGLPLLLAARLGARAGGAARRRLHRRGAGVPRLPAARRHRRPDDDPDHVRDRRRAAPDRVRAAGPARLRGLQAGPGRQRGVRAVPARRLRRGRRRSCSSAPSALGRIEQRLWPRWRAIIEYVETIWREPDDGIWEARGPQRHYTYSKVMAWVVFDRAVRLAERFGLEAPLERWKQVRDEIHAEVCERGYDPERRTFTQYYGSQGARRQRPEHPARRLPARDRRARHRHDRRGLRASSAATASSRATRPPRPTTGCPATRASSWPARSGWSARSRATAASRRRARCSSGSSAWPTTSACSPRSTTSARRRQVGNFPQAFSHLTLILAARAISEAQAADG